jgi:molybdopterin-guanine dinucleotide biosynthesis protein A
MHGIHLSARPIVAGIFVGGSSRRMGGRAKGLLVGPSGETIVGRWRRVFEGLGIPVVLVGERPEYATVGVPVLPDRGAGAGPVAGLVALLAHAERHAIAVACDMPYVSAALVARLVSAPDAVAVAPRREGRWEPFFARYDAPRALAIAEGHASRSLQAVLDALGAVELALTDDEACELRDWDAPPDLAT